MLSYVDLLNRNPVLEQIAHEVWFGFLGFGHTDILSIRRPLRTLAKSRKENLQTKRGKGQGWLWSILGPLG